MKLRVLEKGRIGNWVPVASEAYCNYCVPHEDQKGYCSSECHDVGSCFPCSGLQK